MNKGTRGRAGGAGAPAGNPGAQPKPGRGHLRPLVADDLHLVDEVAGPADPLKGFLGQLL
jgi:hypothetical protein